jgi:2-isopropylmalate synthase
LAMIYDSILYLKKQGMEIVYDAEHFFDGYKNNKEYALQTLEKAVAAGADWIVLCDTNGGSLPNEIAEIVGDVCSLFPTPVGIHAHNDCELGVANSLAAVKAGARQVQGTINGFGERCGNANLSSIIPNLQIKMNYEVLSTDQLASLYIVSRYVNEIANVHMPVNQPFVGASAFAHKGGIHVSAIMRDSSTYEHIKPELVGNQQRVLVSELAGQSNLVFKAQELKLDINLESEQSRQMIQQIKQLEHEGYKFEGADASLELLLREAAGQQVKEIFTVESFKILVEKTAERAVISEAIVKLKVQGETVYTAAEGNGPVNALDNALRKALSQFYPELNDMHLSDYKVRVIDEKDATAAKVRVLIESTDFLNSWSTVGVSENIIEASWKALIDSIRYALIGKIKLDSPGDGEASKERHGIMNH